MGKLTLYSWNRSLYSIFAATAFFSGTVANVLGLRITLSVGGLGYAVYAASFLSYNHNENMGYEIQELSGWMRS
jgi:hypothetical protein